VLLGFTAYSYHLFQVSPVIKEFVLGRSLISFGKDTTLYLGETVGVTLRPASPELSNWSLSLADMDFDNGCFVLDWSMYLFLLLVSCIC